MEVDGRLTSTVNAENNNRRRRPARLSTMSILPILGRAFTRRGDQAGKTKKLKTKKDDEETDDDQDPSVVIDDTDAATTDEAETVETGAAD